MTAERLAWKVVPMLTIAFLCGWLGIGWGLAASTILSLAFFAGAEVGFRDGLRANREESR